MDESCSSRATDRIHTAVGTNRVSRPVRTKRRICGLLALLAMALLAVLGGCGDQPRLSLDDIEQVRLGQPGVGDTNWRPAAAAEVKRLVEYYAEARSLADDFGTTHPAVAEVTLTSGDVLTVWGGGEEFQTVAFKDRQWNIKGSRLHRMMQEIAAGQIDVGAP